MLKSLWFDEAGAIIAAEFILLATLLVIGVIVGLTALRDSIVLELGDVGQAIGNTNQSFGITGTSSPTAFTAGFAFNDNMDTNDGALTNNRGVTVTTPATSEAPFGTALSGEGALPR